MKRGIALKFAAMALPSALALSVSTQHRGVGDAIELMTPNTRASTLGAMVIVEISQDSEQRGITVVPTIRTETFHVLEGTLELSSLVPGAPGVTLRGGQTLK